MAYDLSGVDVFFLAKELKTLENSKVDKIIQIDKKLFTIRLFSGRQKVTLRLLVPDIINITSQKYTSPLVPKGFCTFLRKYLQNTRISKISQFESERILIFEFESIKYGNLSLIIELFKPGNMVLCRLVDDKLVILNSLERQEFKTRTIAAGQEYIFPPVQNNAAKITLENLVEVVKASDKILVKTIAIDLSMGGAFAEEIIARAELDRNTESKDLSKEDIKNIHTQLNLFFAQEIKSGSAKGRIYPVEMRTVKKEEEYTSFNEGLDSIIISSEIAEGKSSSKKKQKSKTEALLDIQQKRIRELERESDENQKIGEYIYEHYQDFSKLLGAVEKMREKGMSYVEIEEELKNNKHFKSLDKAKKTIVLEF
jgi:predicted ribosome quality control (RQC) complex YloA/Tae2 family protein